MGTPVTLVPLGEEFFLARLERARAVPPTQRSPEVAAFVESTQLAEETAELLPLLKGANSELQPALPANEDTAQRVLQALCKWARSCYICGDGHPPTMTAFKTHLLPYLQRGCGGAFPPAGRSAADRAAMLRRGHHAIGTYLWLFGVFTTSLFYTEFQQALAIRLVADALEAANVDGSMDQQLRQMQGGSTVNDAQQLTGRQLLHDCYRMVILFSGKTGPKHLEGLSIEAKLSAVHCSQQMLRLEPNNPRSLSAAGMMNASHTRIVTGASS